MAKLNMKMQLIIQISDISFANFLVNACTDVNITQKQHLDIKNITVNHNFLKLFTYDHNQSTDEQKLVCCFHKLFNKDLKIPDQDSIHQLCVCTFVFPYVGTTNTKTD